MALKRPVPRMDAGQAPQRSKATVGRISIKNPGLCLRGRVGPGQENVDLAFSKTVAINWTGGEE